MFFSFFFRKKEVDFDDKLIRQEPHFVTRCIRKYNKMHAMNDWKSFLLTQFELENLAPFECF